MTELNSHAYIILMKQDKIYDSGGAGFIGSNIVAELQNRNYKDIVVVDWLGNEDKWKNIAKRELAAIVAPENMFEYIEKHKEDIDAIIHMGQFQPQPKPMLI